MALPQPSRPHLVKQHGVASGQLQVIIVIHPVINAKKAGVFGRGHLVGPQRRNHLRTWYRVLVSDSGERPKEKCQRLTFRKLIEHGTEDEIRLEG